MMRKYHAGFGREGACFLPEAIRAWQRTLTSAKRGVTVPVERVPELIKLLQQTGGMGDTG